MERETYFINKEVKDCYGNIMPFKVKDIKRGKYYVVEIKYYQSNCIHKCIMSTGLHSDEEGYPIECELFSRGYEDSVIKKEIKDIYWFNIIQEILI